MTAAATTFAAMLVGGGALWLGCDLVEYELTGFDRPSAKATLAFYVLWAGFLIVPAAYLTAAFSFGS